MGVCVCGGGGDKNPITLCGGVWGINCVYVCITTLKPGVRNSTQKPGVRNLHQTFLLCMMLTPLQVVTSGKLACGWTGCTISSVCTPS